MFDAIDADHDNEEVSADELDLVVAHIRRLTRTASLEFALRVGQVIIHHFYDGDTNAWRFRGPKTASFRRLAKHPELPLSPGALYRCVALYELCERLNAPSRWEQLGASHLRLVLGLPAAMQEQLLTSANAQRWTVKVLHQEVQRAKVLRPSRGGRRPQAPVARWLMSVRKSLCEYRETIDRMGQISVQDAEQSMQLIQEARTCLEGISQSLQAVMVTVVSAQNGTGKQQ